MTPDRNLELFGRSVTARRRAAGVGVEEAAHRSGLSPHEFREVELGRRHVELRELIRIADALEVLPSELLATPPAGAA